MQTTLTKIALEYALSKLEEAEIDLIIKSEFETIEKIELLQLLPENRIKSLLIKLGFKEEFLKTI